MRVGIVGARRARQGLGPFVARDLVRLGAEVVCVLGTSEGTAAAAADQVAAAAGTRPRPLADLDAFDPEDLDVACVLTPAGTHLAHVERALARGRHVLCEKPLLWRPETEWAATARSLEERAAAAGLVLAVNAQWPWVLPAYEELVGRSVRGAQRLAMGLAPASAGVQRLGDSLPHPLSLAQALRPDLDTVDEGVRVEESSPGAVRIEATLRGPSGTIELDVQLDGDARGQPREAWLAIDGVRADRCVRMRDYAIFLRSGARLVDAPDPLRERLATFLDDVAASDGTPREPDRSASRRAAMLAALVEAHDAHEAGRPA